MDLSRSALGRLARLLTSLLLASLAALPASAGDDEGDDRARPARYFAAQTEANLAFLGEVVDGSPNLGSFGYALRLAYRSRDWDLFFVTEHGFWRSDEGKDELSTQILNLGLGIGYSYFEGNVRTTLAGGAAILLTHSQTDGPGSTGFFLDIRPASFRWILSKNFAVELHPLTFTLVAPVLTGIPLVYMSYRSGLTLDFQIGGRP